MERFKEPQTKTVLSECGSRSDVSLAQGKWANINSGSEGDGRVYLASGEVCSLLVENNDIWLHVSTYLISTGFM